MASPHQLVRQGELRSLIPTRLGPDNVPGVLALEFGETANPDGSFRAVFTALALSGTNGSRLWRRQLVGSFAADGSETNVPNDFALITPTSGAVTPNLVIGLETTNGQTGDLATDLVSGSDGSIAPFGTSYSGHRAYPTLGEVPDLNGNGAEDVVIVQPGNTGSIVAIDGSTQAQLWSTPGPVGPGFGIASVGDFSSTTVPDIGIAAGNDQLVVAGSDGHVVIKRRADQLIPLGIAGKAEVPAVGFASFTEGDLGSPRLVSTGVTVTAVGADGTTIYRHRIVAQTKAPAKAIGSDLQDEFDSAGDVQPDGSADSLIQAQVVAYSFNHLANASKEGVIDGRTGQFHALPADIAMAGSLHRGKGTDFVKLRVQRGSVAVAGWDGDSGSRLYRVPVRTITGAKTATDIGARVTGRNCSDQLITAQSKTRGFSGVLAGDGHPAWTLRYSTTSPFGGTLVTVPRPAAKCA